MRYLFILISLFPLVASATEPLMIPGTVIAPQPSQPRPPVDDPIRCIKNGDFTRCY